MSGFWGYFVVTVPVLRVFIRISNIISPTCRCQNTINSSFY
jgi:hypothetical protein